MFILAVLGFNPFAILAAVSTIIVGFAFMINIACSSWVNGLLLILVRRPYDVGDRCVYPSIRKAPVLAPPLKRSLYAFILFAMQDPH
jgi:small-conductance mechanosensitive channel